MSKQNKQNQDKEHDLKNTMHPYLLWQVADKAWCPRRKPT